MSSKSFLKNLNLSLFSNSHPQAYLGRTPPNLAGCSLAWPAPNELRREPVVIPASMPISEFVFIFFYLFLFFLIII
jgi:hypothetical protein